MHAIEAVIKRFLDTPTEKRKLIGMQAPCCFLPHPAPRQFLYPIVLMFPTLPLAFLAFLSFGKKMGLNILCY